MSGGRAVSAFQRWAWRPSDLWICAASRRTLIRQHLQRSLNGYVAIDELGPGIGHFIVPSALGLAVGPLGALAVAADQLLQP